MGSKSSVPCKFIICVFLGANTQNILMKKLRCFGISSKIHPGKSFSILGMVTNKESNVHEYLHSVVFGLAYPCFELCDS